MKIEFLGNFQNILIALSTTDIGVNLAFTNEVSLDSITVSKANMHDFQYMVTRFNVNASNIIDWFKDNNIDILNILPD